MKKTKYILLFILFLIINKCFIKYIRLYYSAYGFKNNSRNIIKFLLNYDINCYISHAFLWGNNLYNIEWHDISDKWDKLIISKQL